MIKILTGRQTDPLQDKILEQAIENYKQFPEHETFIIIPNHIKFTTEVKAINKLAISQNKTQTAVKNLQVLSFSRLAWYFLKDAEQGLPLQLDDSAAAMLLARIIEEEQDKLELFKNVNINSGLVKQLYNTILQIYDGNIDLDSIFLNNKLDLETKNKIHDLRIIYNEFTKQISGKFSTKNEIQLQLNKLLTKTTHLKDASFYFTDFSHFSLQEALTIKLLFNKAKNVTLAFKTKLGNVNPNTEAGDYDYVIQTTIKRLINFMQKRNINYSIESFPLNPKQNRREILNTMWTGTISATNDLKQVQLVKADSRYAEAYFVARTIYQQIALNNYRYHDFLILAPNLHEYETYLTPILRQNKIPYFNDLQQEMKYHPLVVLTENLAKLLKRPLRTQNLLAILKTRLLIPKWYQDEAAYIHDIDELENFVLAHGINHNLWQHSFMDFLEAEVIRLDKMPAEVAKIDKLRAFIVEKVTKLFSKLTNENDSTKAVTIFFDFLIENGVTDQLEKWRDAANKAGNLQQAQQPEQLWSLLITLLKDYLIINPTKFNLGNFFKMLITSFREATFSQIPSTLDSVNISEIGMVQNTGYKQVFIIGATSANLPSIQKIPEFLSSENLKELQTIFNDEHYLEDRQKLNNLDQDYQFGLALSLAQDRVYLSYPVLNASNEKLDPSIFYLRLKSANAHEFIQHDLPENVQEILSFITNPDASLGYLTYLKKVDNGNEIDKLLRLTYDKIPQKTTRVIQASEFDNTPKSIGSKLAQQLYGSDLNSSVSQLETYYENSYEYFLNYGLKLRRRFENEFDVIQAGNYFHETFDRLVKELKKQKIDLNTLDPAKLEELLYKIRKTIKQEGKYAQLMNDPFNKYLFTCLDHTTSKVASNWQHLLKRTPLRAKYSELGFGLGEKVKGLNFEVPDLKGKHRIDLRGKMDRVDLALFNNDSNVLAQVIDYKSSAKKFDLGMFYNGIALQMVSYLDVLSKNGNLFAQKGQLALLGAFYQTITGQLERINSKQVYNSSLEIRNNVLDGKKRLMYTGLISNNPDILTQAEPLLTGKQVSSEIYYGVKTKKDGRFTLPSNRNFSDDEIKLLLEYDEYLIKEASHKILSGEVKLNPYRYGKSVNALTYSDYRDIFFFDAMLDKNKYHEINNLRKKELLSKIKQRLEGKD